MKKVYMLHIIPYHIDFSASLSCFFTMKGSNNLFLIPKYLERDLKLPVTLLSYEELFAFKCNLSKLSETLLLDKILEEEACPEHKKKALKDALKEAFYNGLEPQKLFPFSKEELLFQKIYQKILTTLDTTGSSLKIGNLSKALANPEVFQHKLSKFDKVFALLPNPFSRVFLKLLQKLQVDFIAQGYKKLPITTSAGHPNFWLDQIQAAGYSKVEISGLNLHSEKLSDGLNHLLLPGQLLYTWQEEPLYPFLEIEELYTTSKGEELLLIGQTLSQVAAKKIGIVSPDVKKLKNLYKFLQHYLPDITLQLTVPSSGLEEPLIEVFFQIIDFISRPSLDKIFTLARKILTTTDSLILFQAEKYLIKLEGLNLEDLDRIKQLLIAKNLEAALPIIDKFLSLQDIKKKKKLPVTSNAFQSLLEKEYPQSLMAFLISHLTHFLSLVSIEKIAPNKMEGFQKLLAEIEEASSLVEKPSFNYYKNLLQDLSKRYPITSEEKFSTGSNKIIYLTLPHEAQNYDLVILCDLYEGLWPPLPKDHFFISLEARKIAGYEKNNLIGSTARDFLSTIARSKKTLISTVKEKLLLPKETKKAESRFSLLLKTYKNLLGQPLIATTQPKVGKIKAKERKILQLELDKKPKNLSPTSLEKLMKNPYLYYLHYVLDLKYLPKVFQRNNSLPRNRELGILLHETIYLTSPLHGVDLELYSQNFIDNFTSLLTKNYGKRGEYFFKIWQDRISYIIKYLHHYNQIAISQGLLKSEAEKVIYTFLRLPNGLQIKLQSTLDRLDFYPSQMQIIDYKTGQIPTTKELLSGMKPQLLLEGLLVTLDKNNVTLEQLAELQSQNLSLSFIRLTGLATSTGIKNFAFNLEATKEGLIKIIQYFYCQEGSYKATDAYDHYLEGQILGHLQEIEVKI